MLSLENGSTSMILIVPPGVRFYFLPPRGFAYLILLVPKRSGGSSVASSVTNRQSKNFGKLKGNIEPTPKMTPLNEVNILGQAPPPQAASTATPAMSTQHISESVEPSYLGTDDDSIIDEDPYKQGFFKFFTHKKSNKYPFIYINSNSKKYSRYKLTCYQRLTFTAKREEREHFAAIWREN